MCKILNIGSINIDNVYEVDHFVQAGETLASLSLKHFPGGKGLNQSVALAKAGGDVYHAGKVGKDNAEVLHVLADAGVNIDNVGIDGSITGHAIIQVNKSGQNCILLHSGANYELDKEFIDNTLKDFGKDDILVLQNEVSNISYAMKKAHEKGMRIAFNPSPIGEQIKQCPLDYVTWFLLNEVEGKALSGETEYKKMLQVLADKYPNSEIVLTIGKDGVVYKRGDKTLSHGIYDVPVADTTAAGDTFTGFFVALITKGEAPKETLRLASIASSIAVSRNGASSSIPSLDEVKNSTLRAVN